MSRRQSSSRSKTKKEKPSSSTPSRTLVPSLSQQRSSPRTPSFKPPLNITSSKSFKPITNSLYSILSKTTPQNIIKVLAIFSTFVDISIVCYIIQSDKIKINYFINQVTKDGFYQIAYQDRRSVILLERDNGEMDCTCERYSAYKFGQGKSVVCQHIVALEIVKKTQEKMVRLERGGNLEWINWLRGKSGI